MVKKKPVKKRMVSKKTVKRKPMKKVVRKPVKRKTVKRRPAVRKPVVRKPVKIALQAEVIKRLEQEVRKPKLDVKLTGEKPKQDFRDDKRRQFGKFPADRKRFEKPRRFQERKFQPRRFQPPRPPLNLKSHGERQIAGFLKEERIHFLYEYPLAITDEDRKVRIWYPDFWLPELNIIIEYMGMKGKGDYDRANERKKKVYNALKIDFIEITPGLIVKGNWKRFIAMKIISIMRSKGYLYNKMKALSQKYKIPAETRAKENVGLEVLD